MLRLLSLLSLGLVIGCADSGTPSGHANSSTSTDAHATVQTTPVSFHAGQTLTLHVPDMHCPFGCYPAVKETLEAQEGIDAETITLVEQKQEDTIDDPRVIVTLKGDIDSQQLLQALTDAGFKNSTVATRE